MRLYLVLLPFLFFTQSNLWSWQTTKTMTKTDIKEQLAAKELALKALLKENNLSIKTALTAEELAVLEQAYLLLGVAEAPQDIGKKTFIDYVQDWVKDFISILDEEKRTDIQIDVADIITSLQTEIQKPDFPISMILWKNLKAEISKLASPTTAEGLRKALLNGFNTFNTEIGTKFLLTKHFKENRTTYNKIKKKNLNEQVMIANNFHIWLEKVLEKAEKEQKELEKEQRELEKEQREFNEKLKNWHSEIEENIGMLLVDSIKDHLVNKELFIQKMEKVFIANHKIAYPILTELISSSILNKIKGIKVLTLRKLATAFSNAYTVARKHVRENKADIKIKYSKDASLPSFATIKNIILETKTEITANDLNLLYWDWKKTISSTIEDVATDKGWSTGQLLKTTKLVANFKLAFAGGTDPNSGFLYEVFERKFNSVGKDLITYKEFETLWPIAVGELDNAIVIHNEEVMNTLSGKEIKTLIDSIALPNTKALANAIFNSRYYKPRLKSTVGDTVGFQFIFDDATEFLVDLTPTTQTVGQGVGITLGDISSLIEKNGEIGYSFLVNPEALRQLAPQYNESSKSAVTKFEFSFQVDKSRGSSTESEGKVEGKTDYTEGSYTYTKGSNTTTEKGTNTSNTTGGNTETTDQTDVVHTNNTTTETTEENYNEDSDTYGGDVSVGTPFVEVGVNYSKTKTEGTSNSDVTTNTDETVTTKTKKTVTNEIDTETIEDVDLIHEGTSSSHAFGTSKGRTIYDQNTSNSSKTTDQGKDFGGIKVSAELHSVYDASKKTVTGTFKNVEVSKLILGKIKLTEIKTTPSPLVISVK